MEKNRRYWVHTAWVVVLLLVSVLSWWAFWRTYEVQWTATRFLWALSLPSLLYLRVNVLLGTAGKEPVSYFDHFYHRRKLFFGIGIFISVYLMMTPWVYSLVPWLEFSPIHTQAISLFITSALGLLFRNPAIHSMIVLVSLFSVCLGFWAIPISHTLPI
jgi:hypothetical protein